jgi:hypothetical protein
MNELEQANFRRMIDNGTPGDERLDGYSCQQVWPPALQPHSPSTLYHYAHRHDGLQDNSDCTEGYRSVDRIANTQARQIVSPSTIGDSVSMSNNGQTSGLATYIRNGRQPLGGENDIDSRSHVSKHTSDLQHNTTPFTYVHYAEIPTRDIIKQEETFFIGLLGIPNPTENQIENKKQSVKTLKGDANEWGRQYLQNEFVLISNSLVTEYQIPSVQKFKDIKQMFSNFDYTNEKDVKVMEEIQYLRWDSPYKRHQWKSYMESQYMSQKNFIYKKRTIKEMKANTIGCFAKLFSQIRTDLIKQLQCASKRQFKQDNGTDTGNRGFVKRRKQTKNLDISLPALPYVDIYLPVVADDLSPISFEKSVEDVRKLKAENSLLKQKISDMDRRLSEKGAPGSQNHANSNQHVHNDNDSRADYEVNDQNIDWNDVNEEDLLIPVRTVLFRDAFVRSQLY